MLNEGERRFVDAALDQLVETAAGEILDLHEDADVIHLVWSDADDENGTPGLELGEE